MKKNFVLDTNVLLHDPEAIFKFEDNTVVIPIYVIEEIDQFKKELSERGRNARQISRYLDTYRERGQLGVGVPLESGGVLRVQLSATASAQALNKSLADNLILAVAVELQQAEPSVQTIFVTKDTNLRIRADAMGLNAVNFEDQAVSLDQLYPGAAEVLVEPGQIETFYQSGELRIPFQPGFTLSATRSAAHDPGAAYTPRTSAAEGEPTLPVLYANEYLLLRSRQNPNQTALGRLDPEDGVIRPLAPSVKQQGVWGVRPRNKEQHFALDALLNDKIQLVTLLGKAGTGKTLMALAAGLHKTTEEKLYQRLLVSRPIFPLGRDIGFLPGSVEEKLNPWMQPIFDNIEYLLGISQKDKRAGRGVDELTHLGILEIEPLTFIRGRSIPHQFMIVDEAQNLTPHEVKTILTRVGEGTKIVLTGDPYQIDNPYVDSESNGLTYTINRFKGQKIAATVTMTRGERSDLAELASNLL